MATFSLKIVCPEGIKFDGQIQQLNVRTTTGDLGIQAKHINCVAPLGMGRATIIMEGSSRHAACIGGMVSVLDGKVTLLPTTFEWADEIDAERVDRSYARAQNVLSDKTATKADVVLAEARLRRALVRKGVVSLK